MQVYLIYYSFISKTAYKIINLGTHFRSTEIFHFYFEELAEQDIRVTAQWLCEQHGMKTNFLFFKDFIFGFFI